MQSKIDQPPKGKRQPFQIGLSQLLQFLTVAALWCSAGVVRGNVTIGMFYTVGTVLATWIVIGRWAFRLSPRTSKRVLAATTALLVIGGSGVTVLVDDWNYYPLVFLLAALVALIPVELVYQASPVAGIALGGLSVLLLLAIVYYFWLAVYGAWDRWSERPTHRQLILFFTAFLFVLALPLLPVIFSGCYMCRGHGEGMETKHVWLHCVLHISMLVTAGAIIGLLQLQLRHATGPPPSWLKLLTLGYLCLYAVLLQVGLFPVNFYIP